MSGALRYEVLDRADSHSLGWLTADGTPTGDAMVLEEPTFGFELNIGPREIQLALAVNPLDPPLSARLHTFDLIRVYHPDGRVLGHWKYELASAGQAGDNLQFILHCTPLASELSECDYNHNYSTLDDPDLQPILGAALWTTPVADALPRTKHCTAGVLQNDGTTYEMVYAKFGKVVDTLNKAIDEGGPDWWWFCNPPDAPIWMADLSFRPLGDIVVGDELVGYGPAPKSRLMKSTVTAVRRRQAPILKLTMASGRVVRCTADHRWLRDIRQKPHGAHTYSVPKVGMVMAHLITPTPVVPPDLMCDAGWLGGIYDGEGCRVTISQCIDHNPVVYAHIGDVFEKLGLSCGRRHGGFSGYHITGARQGKTDFLNKTHPVKGEWLRSQVIGSRLASKPDKIVAIESDGVGEVISMTTTTGNYVAWGYASKNCDGFGVVELRHGPRATTVLTFDDHVISETGKTIDCVPVINVQPVTGGSVAGTQVFGGLSYPVQIPLQATVEQHSGEFGIDAIGRKVAAVWHDPGVMSQAGVDHLAETLMARRNVPIKTYNLRLLPDAPRLTPGDQVTYTDKLGNVVPALWVKSVEEVGSTRVQVAAVTTMFDLRERPFRARAGKSSLLAGGALTNPVTPALGQGGCGGYQPLARTIPGTAGGHSAGDTQLPIRCYFVLDSGNDCQVDVRGYFSLRWVRDNPTDDPSLTVQLMCDEGAGDGSAAASATLHLTGDGDWRAFSIAAPSGRPLPAGTYDAFLRMTGPAGTWTLDYDIQVWLYSGGNA